MSKKKSKTKAAKETLAGLSKKDRKALEAREAELAAELAKREAKARKKADKKADARDLKSAKKNAAASEKSNAKAAKKAKKGKASVPAAVVGDVNEVVSESDLEEEPDYTEAQKAEIRAAVDKMEEIEPSIPIIDHTPDEIRTAARRVLDDPNSTPGAREKAETALETADVKERVAAKRKEREARAAAGISEVEHQQAVLKEKNAGKKSKLKGVDTPAAPATEHVAEVVETEQGRVFETGAAPDAATESDRPHFVKPSDAPKELESGRNGYKIIMLDKDGKPDPRKIRQMTRMTTYVNNIDDETILKEWDKRKVIEGLAMDATSPESTGLIPKINDIVHRRDTKIAKAIKSDRKGKLGIGDLGRIMKDAEKEARDALNEIVEEAAHLAGRNDKANLGTHLHTLAEIRDEVGIERVRELHAAGTLVAHDNDGKDGLEPMPVTATDLATIEAYDERMTRLGARVLNSEAVVVDDEAMRAGRLDRVIAARLPELVLGKGTPTEWTRPADQRARRYIMDLKSGNVELGAGKIARQLTGYAVGKLYDMETGERSAHGAARDVGLVFHIPQGEGVCHVYAVDLKAGAAMLKLSGEVRRARNTGKKAIDVSVDITDPAADDVAPTE